MNNRWSELHFQRRMSLRTLCLAVALSVAVLSACGGTAATPTSSAVPATVIPSPTATSGPSGGLDQALVAQGDHLSQQLGCRSCHSINGTKIVGPTWKGLYLSKVTLNDTVVVTADDQYLRESITQPDAKIVQGYQPGVMSGATRWKMDQINEDNNVNALVEYIKSLK